MNYLRPFTTKYKWNRIVEIGGLYLIIFTYKEKACLNAEASLYMLCGCFKPLSCA